MSYKDTDPILLFPSQHCSVNFIITVILILILFTNVATTHAIKLENYNDYVMLDDYIWECLSGYAISRNEGKLKTFVKLY